MPIREDRKDEWENCVKINEDDYGKACVDVAREVMVKLDADEVFDAHQIICDADKSAGVDGLTGFMAGCVAQMVSRCHSRGEEFKVAWNLTHTPEPRDGVINPAILTIGGKGET